VKKTNKNTHTNKTQHKAILMINKKTTIIIPITQVRVKVYVYTFIDNKNTNTNYFKID
jgi:hypothetical protein